MLWLLFSACAGYYLAALAAALFSRPRKMSGDVLPPVSVLKPVRGSEPGFYECIRSHAQQDYPEFELLFAVKDPNDPAIPEIRQLMAEFPGRRIEVLLTERSLGPNAKVSSLERLRSECHHEVLVVSDSDIRVAPDYLRSITAPLADPKVGMVTCPYRGVPDGGLPALFEALWISTDFHIGVLVARLLGMDFALGATMAFRRGDLERIGGFAPLASYLADDYILGASIANLGYHIVLADHTVETLLPRETWGQSWRHRLRWGRTLRVCRPSGYAGMLVTFAIPLAALAAFSPRLLPLAGICVLLRLLAAAVVGIRQLRDPVVLRYFLLIPLADVMSFLVWAGSLFGRYVTWRGTRLRLTRDGKIHRE